MIMKKFVLSTVMMLSTLVIQAQLCVDSIGKVGIGLSSPTSINSALSIGGSGNSDYKVSITASDGGILNVSTSSPSNVSYGIYGNISSREHNLTGIYMKAQGWPTGKTYGIQGIASGGRCAGVYGGLTNSSCGAGVFGSTGNSSIPILSEAYAGYFKGNVYITGSAFARVYTVIPSPEGPFDSIPFTRESGSEDNVTNKLQQLSLIKYTQQKVENGRRDENPSDSESIEDIETHQVTEGIPSISYGLAADQLKEVFPELVYEDKEGNFSINYVEMVPLLVQSIRELSAEVTELRQQLGLEKTVNMTVKQTANIEEAQTEINMVKMEQNKPNPFSSSAVIGLNIPEETQNASIYFYDLTGKQIKSIPVSERGRTNITIYASDLTTGMFIYALIVDGKVAMSRRMIVE